MDGRLGSTAGGGVGLGSGRIAVGRRCVRCESAEMHVCCDGQSGADGGVSGGGDGRGVCGACADGDDGGSVWVLKGHPRSRVYLC